MIHPNEAPVNTPLWCVYGHDCFPTMFCCIINEPSSSGKRAIWGYSIYKRSPGFRTLGASVEPNPYCDWVVRNNPKFFLTQEEALKYLADLTTPKKSAIDKLNIKRRAASV